MNRFSVVTREQAKDAESTACGREGLPQKGKQPGTEALMSSPADEELPAYGRDLTYSGTYAEHDNPVRHSLKEKMSRKASLRACGCRKSEEAKAAL